jgi:hypothetical protein
MSTLSILRNVTNRLGRSEGITMFSHEGRNLKQLLTEFGQTSVRFDYHEPSNTHIAYYMAIGRQGIKGFGHTADFAFERFMENLTETVKGAPAEELKYWSKRCETEANAAKRQAEITELTRQPLSCQIGMAVPESIAQWVSDQFKRYGLNSRNELVTNLLAKGAEHLQQRIATEYTDAIGRELRKEARKGEKEWSQHVTPELQASLILLARRFGVSVAMLTRYMLVKEYEGAERENATQKLSAAGV